MYVKIKIKIFLQKYDIRQILYNYFLLQKFQAKHPGLFQSHSILNIPSKLSENAKSLLLNVCYYITFYI